MLQRDVAAATVASILSSDLETFFSLSYNKNYHLHFCIDFKIQKRANSKNCFYYFTAKSFQSLKIQPKFKYMVNF